MKSNISRRRFLQGTGAAAGFMVAGAYSPLSYALNEKVRLGVIGTGSQGGIHLQSGLAGTPDIEKAAVCDIYAPFQKRGQAYGWSSNAKLIDFNWSDPKGITEPMKQLLRETRKPSVYYDYREMLEKEELDAVLIATPLDTHYQITMDCLDAGKYVFCEKTMCYTIDQAREVVKKCHETGKFVQVGHQRRYNPEYNLARQLVREEGILGRITHIEMQWHRNNNWRRFADPVYQMNEQEAKHIPKYSKDLEHHLNWRIYEEKSLGLCSELFTHQADVSNWFLGELPARIMATGGTDYWRDGRTTEDSLQVVMEYELSAGDGGFKTISARSSYQNVHRINRTYTVRVAYSSIMTNAQRGSSELLLGDAGALELTESHGSFLTREADAVASRGGRVPPAQANQLSATGSSPILGTEARTDRERLVAPGMHLTPHMYQFRDFARKIKGGGVPRTNQMCGLSTTILSALAFQALRERRTIEVDPELMKFDFEVPGWTEYGPVEA